MSRAFKPCERCGRERIVKPERGSTPHCGDCKDVLADLAKLHGNNAGYQRHIHERTIPCADCLAAHRDYQRAWRRRRGVPVRQIRHPECGSEPGYQRHRYLRQKACRPCLDAHAALQRDRKAAA